MQQPNEGMCVEQATLKGFGFGFGFGEAFGCFRAYRSYGAAEVVEL